MSGLVQPKVAAHYLPYGPGRAAQLQSQGHKFMAEMIHVAWRREPKFNAWVLRGEQGLMLVGAPIPSSPLLALVEGTEKVWSGQHHVWCPVCIWWPEPWHRYIDIHISQFFIYINTLKIYVYTHTPINAWENLTWVWTQCTVVRAETCMTTEY